MKCIFFALVIFMFSSCSNSLDGLWIESREIALLKFHKDSVIYNSLTSSFFADTMGFYRDNDSIIFTGLSPRSGLGRTAKSFKYVLRNDTIQIWHSPEEKFVYIRSKAKTFHGYFLSKGGIKLALPKAENGRIIYMYDRRLDIRIGFRNDKITIFIDDIERNVYEIDKAIKDFLTRNDDWPGSIVCRLFVDEKVTCDYTFFVVDHLIANELRRIEFITQTDRSNPYMSDFWGITLPGTGVIRPLYKLRIAEEN